MSITATVSRPVTRHAPTQRSRRRGRRGDYLFLVPAVAFMLLTVVYPLGYNLIQSFQQVGLAEIVNGGAEFVGLDNYRDQFGREEFWKALGVSLVYTFGTVVLTFATGMALAVFFNRVFPGRNLMRALLLLAWILPTVVSATVWRWLLDGSYGLVNAVLSAGGLIEGDYFWLSKPNAALVAVTIATAWTFAPLAMILLLAGLQGISPTLYESARMDGATAWRQFRHITVPVLKPVSLTTALLVFIYTFKTFDTVFIMTGGGPGGATRTLPIYAYQEAFDFFHVDNAAVATTVLLVVPMILSLFYFRSLRSEAVS